MLCFRRTAPQQVAFAAVAGERGRGFERNARLVKAPEPVQQDRRARCPGNDNLEARARREDSIHVQQRCFGPSAMPTATARFSSMIGEGTSAASCAYSADISGQSVASALRASAWQAMMAACST